MASPHGSPRNDAAQLVVALGLMAVGVSPASAQDYSPRRYEARQITTPIQIDGQLDEAAWAKADPVRDFYIYLSGGVLAPQVRTARLLWDNSFVYVGLEVLDQDLRSAGLGHDGALYLGDNAELFLAPTRGTPPYYEFEFSPNGDTFDALFPFDPDPLAYEASLRSAVTVDGTDGDDTDTDTGYTVEFAIPRVSLASFTAGDEWTFLAAGYDYHASGDPTLYLSSPGETPSGFHTLASYDTLVFAPVPEPSTLALAALGGVGLLGYGWRRRKRA
jgi:Carbohydrate family 9 binding domain-like/PEP-CTERM motif